MESFFNLKKPAEVFQIIDQFESIGTEGICLEDAVGRALSKAIEAKEDLPSFFKSTMDGYAVRAEDTFGATEGLPALFNIIGEVSMGKAPQIKVGQGQAVRISTGGMLPEKADGVVIREYCYMLDKKTLEISKAISPLENVIQPGDDFERGTIVKAKGSTLLPHTIGALSGLGYTTVDVFKKPKVAIISTGDEIIAIDKHPKPGEVRDINRYSLAAFCHHAGAEPVFMGLAPDSLGILHNMAEQAIEEADMLWISGGSSVGTRDLTLKVFESLDDFELLVHGISISPGKPTIIGKAGFKPVIGLPGHVASALIVAEVFLARLIRKLAGFNDYAKETWTWVKARLDRNLESVSGRQDYVRVKLIKKGDSFLAEPLFGKSGLISPLVESDGLLPIDINTEGLYKDQQVKVMKLIG